MIFKTNINSIMKLIKVLIFLQLIHQVLGMERQNPNDRKCNFNNAYKNITIQNLIESYKIYKNVIFQ